MDRRRKKQAAQNCRAALDAAETVEAIKNVHSDLAKTAAAGKFFAKDVDEIGRLLAKKTKDLQEAETAADFEKAMENPQAENAF